MYLIRPLWSALFLLLLLSGTAARAQNCVVGVYADEAGTQSAGGLSLDEASGYFRTEVYYVVHFGGFVQGVAWNRVVEVSWIYSHAEIVASEASWEAYGQFLEETDEGYRIGLGSCVSGLNDTPITVMKEVLYLDVRFNAPGIPGELPASLSPFEVCTIRVTPNPLQSSEHPMIDTCTPEFVECDVGYGLTLYDGVPVESESFGRIKSLFRP